MFKIGGLKPVRLWTQVRNKLHNEGQIDKYT